MAGDLRVQSLQDVLGKYDMPPDYERVAPCWRCVEAPEVDDERTMLDYFNRGIPCFAPAASSAPIHNKIPDAIEFISDPKWGVFPTPKIAFQKGWAGPGTDMEAEEMHTMIRSFNEVFEAAKSDGKILNLQFFHRNDPTTHPPMPPLAEKLVWPSFATEPFGGVVCDNATRVSKRGAVTWWHLDDSGEFVMQTGLANRSHQPNGTQPVKLFIYGPRNSYDWFVHDAKSEELGKIAGVHLFKQTDAACFPPTAHLPVFTVAVLRAGGRPLVSPPNIPHLVVTLNDCVMVEQRRVLVPFLDEVAYLWQRVQHWQTTPILYKFLREDLQDQAYVKRLVTHLQKRFVESLDTPEKVNPAHNATWRTRVLASLLAIANHPGYFALPGGVPRKPIEDPIDAAKRSADIAEAEAEQNEALYAELQRAKAEVEARTARDVTDQTTPAEEAFQRELVQWCILRGATPGFADQLAAYWDTEAPWREGGGAVFTIADSAYCGMCYPDALPVFGPVRSTPEAARKDHTELARAAARGMAAAVEAVKKLTQPQDELLDELF